MGQFAVILPAAGRSTRFGDPRQKKLYADLEGRAVWLRALDPFLTHGEVEQIIVAIAPDVATAKAAEAQTEADAKKNAAQLQQGLNITKMPNFAPGTDAFMLEIKPNALGIQGRGLGVLRGTSFAYFDDLAMPGSVPSAAAMQAEAMTVLSRLP